MRSALTSIKGVNKTDVMTLRSNFWVIFFLLKIFQVSFSLQSFSNIVHATPEQLLQCPGFGNLKVRRLKDAVDKPFKPVGPSNPLNTAVSSLLSVAETSADTAKLPPPNSRPPREPSPDWPEWDIDLDLNHSDDIDGQGT